MTLFRMSFRKTWLPGKTRTLLKPSWAAILLLGGGLLLLALWSQARLENHLNLARAQEALARDAGAEALRHLALLPDTRLSGVDLRTAREIARILNGQEPSPMPQDPQLDHLALRVRLSEALRQRRWSVCLALAHLASRGRDPLGPLYEAAAHLELGQFSQARKAWSQTLPPTRRSPLGRRLASLLPLVEEGVRHLVRDRRGVLLGGFNREGTWVPLHPLADQVVQPFWRQKAREAGGSLRLSLDLDLSQKALVHLQGRQGSVVLLDAPTNEVLTAVSRSRGGTEGSPAFLEALEPASISKLVTTVAALRKGLDPDQELEGLWSGPARRYNGKILWNPARMGRIHSLSEAMAGSCNISFAELGLKAGWESLVHELEHFGFSPDQPREPYLGRILRSSGDERELADLSIGLELSRITPLHGALLASVFANEGVWRDPTLLLARDGLLGCSPCPLPAPLEHPVLRRDWLPVLHRAMRAVTRGEGTAEGISPPGFPVAMKTGTGGNWGKGFHINYVGFAPADAPSCIFSVRITHAPRSTRARRAGYALTREILDALHAEHSPHPALKEEPGLAQSRPASASVRSGSRG